VTKKKKSGRAPVFADPKSTSFASRKPPLDLDSGSEQESPGDSEADLSDAFLGDLPSEADDSESEDGDAHDIDADGVSNLEWGAFADGEYEPEARSTAEAGVKGIPFDGDEWEPSDYLFALLPWAWWVNASKQTNRYATQERERRGVGHNGVRGRPWTPTTPEEICGYVGVLLVMALVPLPSVEYFFTDKLGLQFVILPKLTHIMSLMRFQQIKRFFHLADNQDRHPRDHPRYDRLFHVRPMLDTVTKTFKKFYRLGWCVAVDESMVPFKGRSFMKQYIKDKPCKWGFKIWAMCCGATGYFASITVYAGKGSTAALHGLATDSVTTVVDLGVVPKGAVVFMDRWFTSPLLIIELLKRGIYGVGTVQTNRTGLPGDFKLAKSTKTKPVAAGTSVRAQSSVKVDQVAHTLYATSWMDKKPVTFLGSAFGLVVDFCLRTSRDGNGKIQVPVPMMAKMYQDYMDAVDRGDMLKMVYGLVKVFTSFKPWQKLFVGILDITLVNAWVLFQKTKPKPHANHYAFLWKVAEGLFDIRLANGAADRKTTARAMCNQELRKKAPVGNCVHCSQKPKRTRVTSRCINCGVPLCRTGPCNNAYHKGHYKVSSKSINFD